MPALMSRHPRIKDIKYVGFVPQNLKSQVTHLSELIEDLSKEFTCSYGNIIRVGVYMTPGPTGEDQPGKVTIIINRFETNDENITLAKIHKTASFTDRTSKWDHKTKKSRILQLMSGVAEASALPQLVG